MRILFVADTSLENLASGSEQVMFHQASDLAREGIHVHVLARKEGRSPPEHKKIAGFEEACYSAPTSNIPRFFCSLLKESSKLYNNLIKDGPFLAAVCHHPFTAFALLVKRKLSKIPIVHVFHSPAHEEYFLQHENRSRLRNYLPVKSRLWIEKYCLKRATKIMVLSQFMKQKIVDIFHIPADRIIINPGGVDLNSFQPPEDRVFLKKKLNFPEGKIHLLTVRNLEPRMGLDNLLKCIHILKTNKTAIHLVMGGEGPERDNLQNLIQQYNLSNEVAMTGFIPSELLAQYYGAADFFILPTRKLEGFGLITPESLACGTPVLGTPIGGTREILSNFDPKFLFRDSSPEAMAEGIQMAINNYFIQKKSYNDLRLRCREYVEKNYSWQRHSDQLKVILDEVILYRKDIAV